MQITFIINIKIYLRNVLIILFTRYNFFFEKKNLILFLYKSDSYLFIFKKTLTKPRFV